MRFVPLAAACCLLLVSLAGLVAPPDARQAVPTSVPRAETLAEDPLGSAFEPDPGEGDWVNFQRPDLLIRVLQDDLIPAVGPSEFHVDGQPVPLTWKDAERILLATLTFNLEEGLHRAEAALILEGGGRTELTWTFGVDTQVPDLEIDPLPEVAEARSLVLRGTARDPGPLELTVNGREAVLRANGTFEINLVLWPGLNDIVVEARDRADNLARRTLTVELPVAPPEATLKPLVHRNASFALDVPDQWYAGKDVTLKSGNRAVLAVLGPPEPGVQTSLIVLSDRTQISFTRDRALHWMDLVLTALEGSGGLRVIVSQPRILEDGPGTLAVQTTFLKDDISGQGIALMQITLVWSHLHARQWVIMSTVDTRRAHDVWPLIHASTESLRLTDDGILLTRGYQGPDLLWANLLVVTASLFLIALLVSVVFGDRIRAWWTDRRERWRPPRNWRL